MATFGIESQKRNVGNDLIPVGPNIFEPLLYSRNYAAHKVGFRGEYDSLFYPHQSFQNRIHYIREILSGEKIAQKRNVTM